MIETLKQNIIDICKQFIAQNIPQAQEVSIEFDTDFSFGPRTHTIYLALIEIEECVKDFADFCISCGLPEDGFDDFGFSFLHELGHFMTWNEIPVSDIIEYNYIAKKINEDDDMSNHERNLIYFNLPVEKIATEWAINFVKNNFNQYASFCNQVKTIFRNLVTIL